MLVVVLYYNNIWSGQQKAGHQHIIAFGLQWKHFDRYSEWKAIVGRHKNLQLKVKKTFLLAWLGLSRYFLSVRTPTPHLQFSGVYCVTTTWTPGLSITLCTWSPVWGCPHVYLALESWWLAYFGAVPFRELSVVASLYCSLFAHLFFL